MSGSIRIALVDNHAVTRRGIKTILEMANLDFKVVLEASNGKQLLSLINDCVTLPDIVILDISMPEMDGYATIDELQKQFPVIKILVFSLYVAEDAIINAIVRGAAGYLPKSADPDLLIEAVTALDTYGFYLNPLFKQFRSPLTRRSLKGFHGREVLTPKEIQFIKLATGNQTYKEIADQMDIQVKTLENYRDSVFRKLNVNNRAALAIYAIETGIVQVF